VYLKLHSTPKGEVVALCDAELIGRVLADGARRLDLSMFADFYRGNLVGHEEAASALRSAANANIVGKKSMAAAMNAGLDVSAAVSISGVPHLQIYRI
jgi:hypothetical protein